MWYRGKKFDQGWEIGIVKVAEKAVCVKVRVPRQASRQVRIWRRRRFALRFAFRVNVKVAPNTKGGDGLGVRGHPADCEPRSLYKGQNCINIKCLLCLVWSCLASTEAFLCRGFYKGRLMCWQAKTKQDTTSHSKTRRIQRAITRVRKRRRDKAGDLNLNPSPPAPREHNPPPPPPSHCLAAH